MSDISSVSSLSNLSRDLYYQYMIDHNSMSTMFHALSGDDSDSSGTSGLMNAVSSGLTSSLSGMQGLESLSGLLGGSDSSDSLLGASQSISGFAGILESYLNAQRSEAAQMAQSMSEVLKEAAKTEDTSSLTYQTVQDIYQYFQEQTKKPSSL